MLKKRRSMIKRYAHVKIRFVLADADGVVRDRSSYPTMGIAERMASEGQTVRRARVVRRTSHSQDQLEIEG